MQELVVETSNNNIKIIILGCFLVRRNTDWGTILWINCQGYKGTVY